MAQELDPIDISMMPDLRRLAEEVRRTQQAQPLTLDSEELAVLVPAKKQRRRSPSRALPVTEADPLFRLIGIGASNTPGDVSENKHAYLAEDYRKHHMH